MKIVRFLLTTSLLIFSGAQYAAADAPRSIEDIQKYAYTSNPEFELMARAAIFRQSPDFDFTSFRRKYSQTRQYDPMGTKTIERMRKIAFTLETTKDATEYKDALAAYQNLVLEHMAHLGVVMEALVLSKTHPRYGDPELYKWLKHGLIRNVMISGDGYTLQGAYDVITMAEETVIFNYLGMRQIKTVANQEFSKYYNMHSTVLLETGQEYTIFVSTNIPMKFLSAVAQMQEGFALDLRY